MATTKTPSDGREAAFLFHYRTGVPLSLRRVCGIGENNLGCRGLLGYPLHTSCNPKDFVKYSTRAQIFGKTIGREVIDLFDYLVDDVEVLNGKFNI